MSLQASARPFPETSDSPLALLIADLIELARSRGRHVPLTALRVKGWTPDLLTQLGRSACDLAYDRLGFTPIIGGTLQPATLVRLPSRWSLLKFPDGRYAWVRP